MRRPSSSLLLVWLVGLMWACVRVCVSEHVVSRKIYPMAKFDRWIDQGACFGSYFCGDEKRALYAAQIQAPYRLIHAGGILGVRERGWTSLGLDRSPEEDTRTPSEGKRDHTPPHLCSLFIH